VGGSGFFRNVSTIPRSESSSSLIFWSIILISSASSVGVMFLLLVAGRPTKMWSWSSGGGSGHASTTFSLVRNRRWFLRSS